MAPTLAALALLGLASGVHCAGMCGGIVGAFSLRQLAFNAGRLSSYTLAGAAVGAASSAGAWVAGLAASGVVEGIRQGLLCL